MTAEEWIDSNVLLRAFVSEEPELLVCKQFMTEFAKYHVEQALIKAIDYVDSEVKEENIEQVNAILNCYHNQIR